MKRSKSVHRLGVTSALPRVVKPLEIHPVQPATRNAPTFHRRLRARRPLVRIGTEWTGLIQRVPLSRYTNRIPREPTPDAHTSNAGHPRFTMRNFISFLRNFFPRSRSTFLPVFHPSYVDGGIFDFSGAGIEISRAIATRPFLR